VRIAPSNRTTPATVPTETLALFVSDLHLSPDLPKTTDVFFSFLHDHALQTRALYLLGDVFEYWAGDDDLDDAFHRNVINALRELSEHGVAVYWIAGNRDFLVGDTFAAACCMHVLSEPHVADIGGKRVLLLHGDAQCTDDTAYMSFRSQVRDPDWQRAFLARPLAERKAIIASMREGSRDAQRDKPMVIMDVNADEISRLFDAYAVTLMIHGHTHRPQVHEANGQVRHVLPDWDCDADVTRGGWIAMDAAGELHRVDLAEGN
jgi:UDP-2,3-diacylglucosamine hydrolase